MTAYPITDRKIRFALVGCGRISKNHFGSLQQHAERAELVAVCDSLVERAQAASAQTGARPFTSLDALLAGSDADIVVLTTPSGLHPQQAIRVAKAGRHVLSEKPMATKWEEGVAMVQACRDAGVKLFVVKQNRLNATMQLLKKAIDQKRFGRIHMVTVNVFWTRPQSYYDDAPWRGRWDMDGGAFMNQASHYIDLLDWLIGPVESVMAYTGTLARNIEVEDTGVAALRWRNGAMGSVNVTMLTHPKNLEGSITVLGEHGSVRIGGVAVNKIEHWEFAEPHAMDAGLDDASYQTTSVYGHGHPLYYDNVIRTLRGECEPETDGREGLKSLELLIAMYRSARDGAKVNLPLEY